VSSGFNASHTNLNVNKEIIAINKENLSQKLNDTRKMQLIPQESHLNTYANPHMVMPRFDKQQGPIPNHTLHMPNG
jgi:hypothetical protein